MLDAARAIASGGACELTVHARTQAEGYRPPAHWAAIAQIRAAVKLPVIANGEIWSVADARRCRQESGCHALMLGRGLIRSPGLALAIRQADASASTADASPDGIPAPDPSAALPWPQLLPLLAAFWDQVSVRVEPRHRAGRLKQWLGYLRHTYPQAQTLFDTLRTVRDSGEIGAWLARMPQNQHQHSRVYQREVVGTTVRE
jgi:tRNA-dihydrouridine synthase C